MQLFGTHIKSLRVNAGLTQAQLAKRIDVGVTTINNIETGYITSPAPKIVDRLAETFFTDSYSLMHRISVDVGEKAKMVHVVGSISCKNPYIEPEKIIQTVFIDRDELRGYEYLGMRMPDEAMIDAHICRGDSVIVRQDALVKNGDNIIAVYNGCDGIVRTLERNGNKVVLKAQNSSGLYPDICLDAEKDNFRIIGKVVRWEHIVKES